MEREQLMGLYFRLQRELVEAYTAPTGSDGRIERLTDELASVQRVIRAEIQRQEPGGDSPPPGASAGSREVRSLSPPPGAARPSAARSPGTP